MCLETSRLRIVPLSLEQFNLFLCGLDKLEEEMGLAFSGESLDTNTQQAMEMLYKEALLRPDNYYWYTNWQIILKSENKSIGSACFMKEPDSEGQVEVGYGINKAFRNNGYMTEALFCLCQWAFRQDGVKAVVAETDADNYSSHMVLKKAGMERYQCSDESIWWKIGN